MSFFIYDLILLVVFIIGLCWFLYSRRKNVKREGIMFLYRTQIGIKAIDWFSSKFKKPLEKIQYVSIIVGYLLMFGMLYLFFQLVYIYIKMPEIVRAVKVPPIIPLIPYLPSLFKISFLPEFYFTYWILAIAVVAICHEFAHGIFAKLHGITVKSTGFGFLGPFLAAFVEPDEKEMEQKPVFSQLSILCAGTFANILVSIAFIFLFVVFFAFAFTPSGAVFDTYAYDTITLSDVTSITSIEVENPTKEDFLGNLNKIENFTKISVGSKEYLLDNNKFVSQFENINEIVVVFENLPAVNSGLKGIIIGIDNQQITCSEDLRNELAQHRPGDEIIIKTRQEEGIKEYKIILADKNGKAYLGIASLGLETGGIKGKLAYFISLIKKPGTYYDVRFDGEFVYFIYNLLWWMVLINLSVALVNMLPLGIFDGGKVFYLTIFALTKSEKIAKNTFKFITSLLLFLIAVVVVFWAIYYFNIS